MNKNKQRGYIDVSGAFKFVALCCIGGGVAIGFVLFVAIPWAWQFIKPWIHSTTG
ncbi:MAG: hypothetical protein WC052_05735 [Patescibacteria group bacterium]